MKQITSITLEATRVTKNTVRFDAPESNEFDTPSITTLYVAKSAFKELGHFPAQISVTVTVDNEKDVAKL